MLQWMQKMPENCLVHLVQLVMGCLAFEKTPLSLNPNFGGSACSVSQSWHVSTFHARRTDHLWIYWEIKECFGQFASSHRFRALIVLLKLGWIRLEFLEWPFGNLCEVPVAPRGYPLLPLETREHTYPCIQQKEFGKIQQVKLLLVWWPYWDETWLS